MMAFIASWRDMGWEAALVFVFGFAAVVCMVVVWLLQRGRDDWGRYIPPKDLRRTRFTVGKDAKHRNLWLS